MSRSFVFSIIMAVYNVEAYLRESIDSVIAQDFGFERIQLILVEDGSPDNSGLICDEYAERYPENIAVIHKENGGVSSARNAGLKAATGELVNFLDSDDLLTPNTCSAVYRFWKEYGNQTDVVSIPMVYFEAKNNEHVLNYKFKKGTRLVDLKEEYDAVQLSTSSAFMRRAVIDEMELLFNEKQKYAEDAAFLQPILWKKMTMGVVSTCKYMYRARSAGPMSAVQSSVNKREWWLDYLLQFPRYVMERAQAELGEVPQFVQYVIAYHLQWRIMEQHFPRGLLSEEEIEAYWNELRWIYSQIDDSIIMQQRDIGLEHKLHILRKKYGEQTRLITEEEGVFYSFESEVRIPAAALRVRLDFLKLEKNELTLEGCVPVLQAGCDEVTVYVNVNGTQYPTSSFIRREPAYSLDEEIASFIGFRVSLPLDQSIKNEYRISISSRYKEHKLTYQSVLPLSFFPISKAYTSAYYAHAGWIAEFDGYEIRIRRNGIMAHVVHEARFLFEVWKKNLEGGRKAVPVRILRHILNKCKRSELWLVSDRVLKADDNGEAFFIYLNQRKEKRMRTYFVIGEESPDYGKIEKIGKVVKHFSFKHKLMRLLCDYNVSSAAEETVVNPFSGHHEAYRDILWDTKYIFLQHGITKDDQTRWLNRYNKAIDGFVTAAKPEYSSILNDRYFYSEEQVWLTGMPRYDRLYHQEENLIALMPTWRRYLMDRYDVKTGVWTISERFKESDYYRFYNGLMNHPRLLKAMADNGYRMVFLPHPNLMPHLHLFDANALVAMGTTDMQYRDVYARSKLVVSDYSSAVFDFSYLRKPIVYAHFDAEAFFAGEHMYKKGYFEYERDGFGEVTYNLDETAERIIAYIENDCKLKEEYRSRIDAFFAFQDSNNSQRVYEKIRSIKQ